ncbi:MAG: hypothetical protein V1859_02240 [archaeon]
MQKNKPIEIFSNLKSRGKFALDGILTLEDNSIFAVIEVTHFPFYDFDKKTRNQITEKINTILFKKLSFPVELLIRPVNLNIDKKIAIMNSILTYNVNKTDKPKLIECLESFMKWFSAFGAKLTNSEVAYYLTVNYKGLNNEKGAACNDILQKRIEFVISALNTSGIKSKQLTTAQIENVYKSFLSAHIYVKGTYYFAKEWIALYRKEAANEDKNNAVYDEIIEQVNLLSNNQVLFDRLKMGNMLYRGIIVVANPEKIMPDFVNKIYQNIDNVITSVNVSPESVINVVHHLMHELSITEKEINSLALEGKISGKGMVALENRRNFLKEKIEKLMSEELMPFKLSLTFLVEEINDENLDYASNSLMSSLRKLGFVLKFAVNYQKEAFLTILPSGANYLRRREIIVANDLVSTMFNFSKR